MDVRKGQLRERMQLTALETVPAREHVANCLIMSGVGVLPSSSLKRFQAGGRHRFRASFYFLIGPAQFLNGKYFDRLKQRISAAEAGLVSTGGG